MTGNSRHLIYLIRHRLKRSHHLLVTFLLVPNRSHALLRRLTRVIPLSHLLNDRVRQYLEMLMMHALNHPWMQWTMVSSIRQVSINTIGSRSLRY